METAVILGVPVSAIDMCMAVSIILDWIEKGESKFVCVRDVHGLMCSVVDEEMMEIQRRAGLVTPDGMPLSWIGRMRGHRGMKRVAGADLVEALCAATTDLEVSHFFYGGKPGVAEKMVGKLQETYPGLRVAGVYSPPFRSLTAEEDDEIVDKIQSSGAKIVWVGISTPKQEFWMRDHVSRIPKTTLIGVGAAFDFHAGVVRRAPKWMQRTGLEWLHRLWSEPHRLWRRYLITAPKFVFLALREQLSGDYLSKID